MNADDLYLLLGMGAVSSDGRASFRDLSRILGVPVGFIQRHLALLERARLVDRRRRPNLGNARELLISAARFIAPATLGEVVPGIPTAWAAPPLAGRIVDRSELPPVWPSLDGPQRGRAVEPLHKAAPDASKENLALRELLVLVDALRLDDPRVHGIASEMLSERLDALASSARR